MDWKAARAENIKKRKISRKAELDLLSTSETSESATTKPKSSTVTQKTVSDREMKALLLGAGFGTRLERDVRNDMSGLYSSLIGVPKPLLPIGHRPLATHWARDLRDAADINGVCIVTNGVNHGAFEIWAKDWPHVQLACEGATSNETRSGAIACMDFGAKHLGEDEDIMIIAGDTLFYEDFRICDIIAKFNTFREREPLASILVYVTCTDEEVHKYGILETDGDSRVTAFLEKPQSYQTMSRKECPCFYILSRHAVPLLQQFLEEKKDEPLKARDASGNFIAYLYPRMPVFATEISGRFDVGGLQSYVACHEHFLQQESDSS